MDQTRAHQVGWIERAAYDEPETFFPDERWKRLLPPLAIKGYMQHPDFFRGAEEEMLKRFSPVPRRALEDFHVVTVNLRVAADYRTNGWVIPPDWYRLALRRMAEESPIRRIRVICDCDAVPDAYESVLRSFGEVFIHRGDVLDHMAALASSGRLVGTNSTFSWWSAWLGMARDPSQRIVFPAAWIPNMAPPPKTFFPPEWIAI